MEIPFRPRPAVPDLFQRKSDAAPFVCRQFTVLHPVRRRKERDADADRRQWAIQHQMVRPRLESRFGSILQSGRSAGISGEIAGGAETFFGKNKARTLNGMLGRWTTYAAIIFVITSLALTIFWNA